MNSTTHKTIHTMHSFEFKIVKSDLIFRSSIIIVLLALLQIPLTAQNDEDLPSNNVVITKDYEVELLDFDKIKILPDAPEVQDPKSYPYTLSKKIIPTEYAAPDIKPLGYKAKSSFTEGYKSYARLGYGLPSSLYGLLSFGDYVTDNLSLNGNLFYRSLEDDSYDYRDARKLNFNIGGNFQSDYDFAASANAYYRSDRTDLYGFDHANEALIVNDTTIPHNEFDQFGLSVGISDSKGEQNPFLYSIDLAFDRFTTNHDLEENSFDADAEIAKWFDRVPIKLGFEANLTKQKYDTIDQNLDVIRIIPATGFHGESFRIDGGVNLAYFNDEFTVFPQVEIAVNLIGSGLQLYGGVTGDARPLTHEYISKDNPYILPYLSSYLYQDERDYYGGVQGNVSNWKYFAQVGYKNVNNLNLYGAAFWYEVDPGTIPSTDIPRITEYDVVLDTADIFYIKGNIEFPITESIQLLSAVQYNVYDLNRETEAWYLPDITFNAGLNLNLLEDKLNIQTIFTFANTSTSQFFAEDATDDRKTNTLTDFSISADWFIVDNIGLFLDLNNLLDNNYARFYDYQSTGLNVNFGLVARL